jgi:CheY-like chemotaxis protein
MQTSINNWEMVSACDGRSVIETWRNGEFDLILMDVQMPGLDGCEVTRMIRSEEKTAGGHIPILALTAHTGEREPG